MAQVQIIVALQTALPSFDLWVVGGCARWLWNIRGARETALPVDIDLLAQPFVEIRADRLIRELRRGGFKTGRRTGFGGLRLAVEGVQVDIWAGFPDHYLPECPTAIDGLAIRWRDKAVLMTAECASVFYGGRRNHEITTRRTRKAGGARGKVYLEHLRKQGLRSEP